MSSDNFLFITIILIICLTFYGILSCKVTKEDKEHMLKEDFWF